MKLESVGIIIGLRPFEERDSIARIFTRGHGVLAGMMKGAQVARKNKPLVGQYGPCSWNARLDSQLGVFHFESERNMAAPLMSDSAALSFMNSAFALLTTLLPERAEDAPLFDMTIEMLRLPSAARYLDWEVHLLRSLGYALDLSACGGCGRAAGLEFLSQRTGRAVCAECAAPYMEHVFPMPVDLAATRFFLSRAALTHGVKLPIERAIFPLASA
ncbi:MAG: DNA repair protein RecO [Alphaproteobacteria bacterium]|nr:DNA repair protein RecO [Alphaproteobacteria bacterium]MCL2758392.1 DNA repair protein RecO [Alphaproteobacteria bacterium]